MSKKYYYNNMNIGTHNSATSHQLIWWQRPFKWAIQLFCACQNRTIEQQCEDGVTFFNLQVAYDGVRWVISHGFGIYDYTLDDAIDTILKYSETHNTKMYVTIGEDNSFFYKKNPFMFSNKIMGLLDSLANSLVYIIHATTDDLSIHPHNIPYIINENYWMWGNKQGLEKYLPFPKFWAKKNNHRYRTMSNDDNIYLVMDFYNIP